MQSTVGAGYIEDDEGNREGSARTGETSQNPQRLMEKVGGEQTGGNPPAIQGKYNAEMKVSGLGPEKKIQRMRRESGSKI